MEAAAELPDNLVARDLRGASAARLACVRERNFSRTLDLVFQYHPYYHALFRREGIERRHLASLADLGRVPVLTKSDFVKDPDSFRMRITDGPDEWRTLWDVMYTSGTSGAPSPFFSTTYDYYNILTAGHRMLDLRGVRDDDIISNLNPMTAYPTGAYNRTLQSVAARGIPVFSPLPGNPSPYFIWGHRLDEVVRMVERFGATILWGITSYIRRLVHRAGEMGADFSRVRLVFVSGEATTPSLRADLIAALKAAGAADPWVSVSYGQTETQAGLVECRHESGLHNPLPEGYLWEAVDADSFAPVADGETGLALLSHLDRRGTLLLRYALGDRIALDRRACPHCGAIGERVVTMPARSDGRLKIKGTLVETDALVEAVRHLSPDVDFVVVLDKADHDPHGMDRLTVRLAQPPGAGVAEAIGAELKRRFLITAGIVVDPAIVLDMNESQKRRFFIDRRPKSAAPE